MIDGSILYHGSYCTVKDPELKRCARYKDFGQGFYLTSPTADTDWPHCVVAHRRKNTFPTLIKKLEKYDIIAGKIANDDTNATIAAYMTQAYGTIGTKSADDMCISLLLPERLQDQYCFRTDRALECITFVESEQVWI